MCSSSSKSPVSPVSSSVKSSTRCCSSSQPRVTSSAGKTAPVAPRSALVVAVLEVALKDVVVDVDHGGLDAHALLVEELELHHRHRPGRVLRERLVDPERDLAAGRQLTAFEMVFEDRPGERGHVSSLVAGQSRPDLEVVADSLPAMVRAQRSLAPVAGAVGDPLRRLVRDGHPAPDPRPVKLAARPAG